MQLLFCQFRIVIQSLSSLSSFNPQRNCLKNKPHIVKIKFKHLLSHNDLAPKITKNFQAKKVRIRSGQGMLISLWVCSESRQRGWARI